MKIIKLKAQVLKHPPKRYKGRKVTRNDGIVFTPSAGETMMTIVMVGGLEARMVNRSGENMLVFVD